MKAFSRLLVCGLSVAVVLAMGVNASVQGQPLGQELTVNGDFETGTTAGWTPFIGGGQTFTVTGDAASGSFAGVIDNPDAPSGAVVKQANIGIGDVNPGDLMRISFDAKGEFGVGGVAFAEFFSEFAGGGATGEILGGGPLSLTNNYQPFSFDAIAGGDVGGGVTLQFNAATGAVEGSTATLFIDNASVRRVVPEPATASLLFLGSAGILLRRRRR